MSQPPSARGNDWRDAKAIADLPPNEAVTAARELASSESGSVIEEIVRSLVSILLDPSQSDPKTPIVKEIGNLMLRKRNAKGYLGADGASALAGMLSGLEEAAKTHAAQVLMTIGRDEAVHGHCVDACLDQLRDDDNTVVTKISLCRVLNVIMLHDGGATIVARKGIVDIARILSVDKTWDSFAVKTLTALANGTSERDADIVNALLDVASGANGGSGGKLRGNLARLLSILSAKNKTSVLQSQDGVHTAIPVVVDLLKEDEDAARAYATECLLNICKGDARVSESNGNMTQGLERVSSYVIFSIIKLLQEGETEANVTALTLEKACRLICALIVDKQGQWRFSKVWQEKELVNELGIVIAEAEGSGSVPATVWACRILASGLQEGDEGQGEQSPAQARKKMMQAVLPDSLRWAMHEGEAFKADQRVRDTLESLMHSLGINTHAGALGIDYHIKVVRKNVRLVSGRGSKSSYQYDGERGRRIYHAVQKIRQELSAEAGSQPFESAAFMVCESGVLGHLVALLDERADKYHQLELETLWALTNLCSGNNEQTRAVVEAGAVPSMVRLLNSEDKEVQDQALWALANIAGDSGYTRDVVIASGIVDAVQMAHARGVLHNQKSMEDLTFMVQNIMRTKPLPHAEATKGLIPILCDFLKHIHPDEDSRVHDPMKMGILSQALWGLSGFTSQDEDGELSMDVVMEEGLVPIIVTILRNNMHSEGSGRVTGDGDLITPGSRILGNFCGGSEAHTQAVIDARGMELIFNLTRYDDTRIQKEAWFTISNVGAGSGAQVEALIRLGVFSRAFDILSDTDWSWDKSGTKHKDPFFFGAPQEVKSEIVWLVINVLPEDESEGELLRCQSLMTLVLSSKHSQAGEEHDEEDVFHGVTALFEAVSVFENEIINRIGDVETNVDMATRIMTRLKILTSDRCLAMNPGIAAKIKERGKRLVGILRTVLRQPGNLARCAEDITESIIMHL